MPNLVNKMVVREYSRGLEGATSLLVVGFRGLTVAENDAVRGRLAEQGVEVRMVRNRLLRRVLAERGLELDAECLLGNNAVAWGDAETAIKAAKVLSDKDAKKLKKLEIKGGVLDGEVLDADQANQLADIPDQDSLRAMLLGVIAGPARGLACVIDAVPSAVARVISAHADQGQD